MMVRDVLKHAYRESVTVLGYQMKLYILISLAMGGLMLIIVCAIVDLATYDPWLRGKCD